MTTTPSIEQVARAAARYAVAEFSSLSSWLSYEDALAAEWLKNSDFVCAVEYAIAKVIPMMRWNKQMAGISAQYGGGATGNARVIGMIVGEWANGHTTIDREIASWG